MIWLSVNLDCFIAELSSSMVENSTFNPVYLQGVLPFHVDYSECSVKMVL